MYDYSEDNIIIEIKGNINDNDDDDDDSCKLSSTRPRALVAATSTA